MPATINTLNELHIGDIVIKTDLSQSCRDGWISSLQSRIVERLRKEIKADFGDYDFPSLSRSVIKSLLLCHPELFSYGKFGILLRTSKDSAIDTLESIAEEILERFCLSGGVTYEVTEVEDPFGGERQSMLAFTGNCWESLVASWWMQLAVRLIFTSYGNNPSDMASLITKSDYDNTQSYYGGSRDKARMSELWKGKLPCPPSNLWVIAGGGPVYTKSNDEEIAYSHNPNILIGLAATYYEQLMNRFQVKEITENAEAI